MAKFYGKVGYAENVETKPSVWEEKIIDRYYYGEVNRNNRRINSSGINDDVNITNELSILSDPYANEHFYAIRYVEFMGTKWKVTNVEVQYPRLILSLGGLYNGPTGSETEE